MMSTGRPAKLLLFDIDGTLIQTGSAGLLGFARAFRETFGHEDDLSRVDFAGATDSDIIRQLFELHGVAFTPGNAARFRDAYFPALAQILPERQGCVLPGVQPLLEMLSSREDVQLALLTGNFAESARLKLRHYGLWNFFPFGAFADDALDRNKLGPVALRRAREFRMGEQFDPATDVWIIGDTPKDIACARAFGARALAVATGRHRMEQLAADAPDAVLADLARTDQVMNLLLD
jgi:phosphoglycolate phosphatase-like HAD superfamily hydrolase